MVIDAEILKSLKEDLYRLIDDLSLQRSKRSTDLDSVLPLYRQSAENLLSYIAFRKKDRREIQKKLGEAGLSRLARAEAHIEYSINQNYQIISHLLDGRGKSTSDFRALTIRKASSLLAQRTNRLLGSSEERRTRVMVTMPSEAAWNKELIAEMIDRGMDIARINCAHDDPAAWLEMIKNIRESSRDTSYNVKIAMDLAGPKLRTGEIEPGPRVLKFSPVRNFKGEVIKPASIPFTIAEYAVDFKKSVVIESKDLNNLQVGQEFKFKDTRGKKRRVTIVSCNQQVAYGSLFKTSFLDENVVFSRKDKKINVVAVPPVEQFVFLKNHDELTIAKSNKRGRPAVLDSGGNILKPARISITEDKVFEQVKKGESIFFDDGKIGGLIEEVSNDVIKVRITNVKEPGAKLHPDKGINLPQSNLDFGGLTSKDQEDLEFVVTHADIVNVSFVNDVNDVLFIQELLDQHKASVDFGVVLKIETQKAFNNFSDLLLTAMRRENFGVMIARGDLAIETGWDQIGLVQKELLAICNAAHVPVIWATQVLETLAKKGLPSRSEITDSVNAIKADCVMLNKGPHILKAIGLLTDIIKQMEAHQEKNAPLLPGLHRI